MPELHVLDAWIEPFDVPDPEPVDITVTATLEPSPWAALLAEPAWSATIDPSSWGASAA